MTTIADLTVINAAATRTGNEPISTTLEGSGTPVAALALNNYEDAVKTELSLYPWKRATKIVQLARLDPAIVGEPPEPWTAAYQFPNDMMEVRTVKVGGRPINYEVHSRTVLCDAAETDEVILHYIWRVPESQWPAWFREGMIRRLEAMFLRGIGERAAEARVRDAAADESFALARNRDAQQQTPRDPTRSPTLSARLGGSSWNSWPR